MADVIKKLDHTVTEVDEHLDSTEQHIQEGERDKWNKAADTADAASTTATAAQSEAAINRSTLGCQGKNLLNVTATSQTINGITFTVNDDKSITVNGTATADAEISLRIISLEPNVNYYLSGCPQGGATTTYHIYSLWIDDYSSGGWDTGSGKIIKNSTESARKIQFRCRIMSGTTVDNLTFYPMLRYAEITDDTYEPYKESVDARLTALESLNGDVHMEGYSIKSGESLTLSNISVALIHFTRHSGTSEVSSLHAMYTAANMSIDLIKTPVGMTITSAEEGTVVITNNSTLTTVGLVFYKLRS